MFQNEPITREIVSVPLRGLAIETSEKQSDGSYVIRITTAIPAGVIQDVSPVLDRHGRPPNALRDALAGPAVIHIPLWEDQVNPCLLAENEHHGAEGEDPDGQG